MGRLQQLLRRRLPRAGGELLLRRVARAGFARGGFDGPFFFGFEDILCKCFSGLFEPSFSVEHVEEGWEDAWGSMEADEEVEAKFRLEGSTST